MHLACINGMQVSVWHEPGRVRRKIAQLRTKCLSGSVDSDDCFALNVNNNPFLVEELA